MDDLIGRQAAIDAINALHEKPNAWLDSAVDAVMALPSAQPKHGRWIVGNKTSVFDLAGVETWAVRMTCSECSFSLNFVEGHTSHYKFCPNCGARMEEDDAD